MYACVCDNLTRVYMMQKSYQHELLYICDSNMYKKKLRQNKPEERVSLSPYCQVHYKKKIQTTLIQKIRS